MVKILNYKTLLILFYLTFSLLGYSQNTSIPYTDKYKLDFNIFKKDTVSYGFLTNYAYAQHVGHASIHTKDNKFGELFIPNPFYRSMRTVMRRRVLLPELPDKKTGSIFLGLKGNELKYVTLRVQGLDFQENVLFNDTLSVVPDTVYSNLQGEFPLENVRMLDITFDIEGNENKKARYVFSGLEIKMDDRLINDMPFPDMSAMKINRESIVPIIDKSEIPFDKIKELRGKKIIALGESLHHHQDVRNIIFRLMEESIHQTGCRMLVIEMPIEMSLFCNRYISDMSFVLPETLLDKPGFNAYVPLLEKLRSHNGKCSPDERVRLLGMDYNTNLGKDNHSLIDLFDFLYALNKNQPTKEADHLLLKLYDNKPKEALEYLKAHGKELRKVITADEQLCMGHILSFTVGLSKDPVERKILRDSMMAENLSFIEQNFAAREDDKVMVSGHTLHLNRLSSYPLDTYRPAGSYLQAKYGNRYASFLLVTDCGYHNSVNPISGSESVVRLQYPCNGSVESALSQASKTSCYMPITKEHDNLVLSRFLGNPSHTNFQFYPFNLYQRHDGVFYIKAQKALRVEENTSSLSMDEQLKELTEKSKEQIRLLNEKKASVDEIRKRCEGYGNGEQSGQMQEREDGVYLVVDELAEFPGGTVAMQKFIVENFKRAANTNAGMVLVNFVVNADGTIRDAKVVRSVSKEADNEALRVVGLMPKWKPAKVGGKVVPMVYNIPFRIQ